MKQTLASKIKTKKKDVASLQTSTSMAVFDSLPVTKLENDKPKDAVSDFLEKAAKADQEA